MTKRIVVVGGDAAGMSAASQARRLDRDLEILVFERGPHTSYSACGIPYLVAGLVEDPNQLVARTPEAFRAQGIDVRVRHEVTALDPSARRVTVHDLVGGRVFEEPYDELLLATGATPLRGATFIDLTETYAWRLRDLARLSAEVIDLTALRAANLVPIFAKKAKVILSGALDKPVTLRGLALTKGARAAVLAAGGVIHE